jgi:hypothetical protein
MFHRRWIKHWSVPRFDGSDQGVMAGLDPAIHVLLLSRRRGLLRFARNDDGEVPAPNFPRHCEERELRSNPALPLLRKIASLRSPGVV